MDSEANDAVGVPSSSATPSPSAPPTTTTTPYTSLLPPTSSSTTPTTTENQSSAPSSTPAPSTTKGGGGVAPVKPTASDTFCPTGFYGCLATAGGGCCQTGRDCAVTSCPPMSSTTVESNGVTIVVPVTGIPSQTADKTCAGGWFLCGEDGGPIPGCCPSGYSCGTASCSIAVATATDTVQKKFPNQAASRRGSFLGLVGFVFGVMVMAG